MQFYSFVFLINFVKILLWRFLKTKIYFINWGRTLFYVFFNFKTMSNFASKISLCFLYTNQEIHLCFFFYVNEMKYILHYEGIVKIFSFMFIEKCSLFKCCLLKISFLRLHRYHFLLRFHNIHNVLFNIRLLWFKVLFSYF